MGKPHSPGLWIAAALAAVVVALVVLPPGKPAPPAVADRPDPTDPTDLPAPTVPTAPAQPAQPAQPTQPLPPTSLKAPEPDDLPPPPKPILPADRENTVRVLDNIQFALRDFRSALGENPVGTNAEITSALLGNNRKQAKVALPDGATVNAAGELCDLWGTPYFFHQVSGTKMEIRSAGPDQKLWTPDDVTM